MEIEKRKEEEAEEEDEERKEEGKEERRNTICWNKDAIRKYGKDRYGLGRDKERKQPLKKSGMN